MLNKSTSPSFKPIVVRNVWLILSWCIRDTFCDLKIELIISSIFLINSMSPDLCNRHFWHIESEFLKVHKASV